MTKPKPCQHRRWVHEHFSAYVNDLEDGSMASPDPRRKFRVLDVMRCAKCGTAGSRWTRFHGQTERAALKHAGVPEHELPAPPNHKIKAVHEAPLTSWPFPVSAHQEGR